MSAECDDGVCITCSDQLLALVVEQVDEATRTARGTIDGRQAEVSIDLLGGVHPGDVLLCHGGVALQQAARDEVET